VQDTGQAQEKANEVAGQAQEKVQGAAQQAKGRISDEVDQRSTQAGQQVNTVAQDVRSVAEELRSQGKDKPAQYAEQAAERVQSAGQWLEQKNGDELLRDVEDFARRNPWAVAAGGLVLGLAASRFLKASSTERYRASVSNGNGTYGQGSYGQAGSLASEPMPSGAATTGGEFGGGGEFNRQEGSMISTEPRT
jgi:uncharacterized protein YjbJ (UPF0337 family)